MVELSRHPLFDPASSRMPNLRGLANWLPNSLSAEILLALVVIIVSCFIYMRATFWTSAAVALNVGLLIGHHAYLYDSVLLLPSLLLVCTQACVPRMLRLWGLLLLTPVCYMLILSNRFQVLGQLLVVGFPAVLCVFIAASYLRWHGRQNAAREAEPQSATVFIPAAQKAEENPRSCQ